MPPNSDSCRCCGDDHLDNYGSSRYNDHHYFRCSSAGLPSHSGSHRRTDLGRSSVECSCNYHAHCCANIETRYDYERAETRSDDYGHNGRPEHDNYATGPHLSGDKALDETRLETRIRGACENSSGQNGGSRVGPGEWINIARATSREVLSCHCDGQWTKTHHSDKSLLRRNL